MQKRMLGPVLAAAALAGLVPALTQPALAQRVFTTTTSSSVTQTITTQTEAVTVSDFLTRLIARSNTGLVVFDQSFPNPFGSAPVETALTAARAAIVAEGGPAVVISDPVRTQSQSHSTSTSASIDQVTSSSDTLYPGVITFGPDTLFVGDLGICQSISAEGVPSGCTLPGVTLVLGLNDTNINVHTNVAQQILRTTTTTTTTTLQETYELAGVGRPAGRLPFQITHIVKAGTDVTITWESTEGAAYTIERAAPAQLATGNFEVLQADIEGAAGETTSFTDTGAPEREAYYRVRTK